MSKIRTRLTLLFFFSMGSNNTIHDWVGTDWESETDENTKNRKKWTLTDVVCLNPVFKPTRMYHRDLHSFKFHSTSGYRQDCLSICCGLVLLKKLIETSLRVSHSVLRLCGKGFEEEELLLFCGRQALKR